MMMLSQLIVKELLILDDVEKDHIDLFRFHDEKDMGEFIYNLISFL